MTTTVKLSSVNARLWSMRFAHPFLTAAHASKDALKAECLLNTSVTLMMRRGYIKDTAYPLSALASHEGRIQPAVWAHAIAKKDPSDLFDCFEADACGPKTDTVLSILSPDRLVQLLQMDNFPASTRKHFVLSWADKPEVMAVLNRLEAKFIFLALGDQLGQIDNLITATKIDDDSDDQYSLNLEKAVKLSCYLTTNDLAKVLIGTNDMNRWADILSKPAFCFHVTCAHEEYQFVGKILVSLREYSAYNRLIDALRDHDRHGRIGHEREVLPLALRAELLLSPNTHAHRPA